MFVASGLKTYFLCRQLCPSAHSEHINWKTKAFSATLRIFFTGSCGCWECSHSHCQSPFLQNQVTSQCNIPCCRYVVLQYHNFSPLHLHTFVISRHQFKYSVAVERGLVELKIFIGQVGHYNRLSMLSTGLSAFRTLHVSFCKQYFNSLCTSLYRVCFQYENKLLFPNSVNQISI